MNYGVILFTLAEGALLAIYFASLESPGQRRKRVTRRYVTGKPARR